MIVHCDGCNYSVKVQYDNNTHIWFGQSVDYEEVKQEATSLDNLIDDVMGEIFEIQKKH